ncbi:hypothetical protein ACFY1U_12675 [Streptomyces sp. NPDC001351]|uniref:hypothetical protein n=1 Tax=Streptomyces sp. NPDC001351 TaxID=3364564 RepID=UPI003686AC74
MGTEGAGGAAQPWAAPPRRAPGYQGAVVGEFGRACSVDVGGGEPATDHTRAEHSFDIGLRAMLTGFGHLLRDD